VNTTSNTVTYCELLDIWDGTVGIVLPSFILHWLEQPLAAVQT